MPVCYSNHFFLHQQASVHRTYPAARRKFHLVHLRAQSQLDPDQEKSRLAVSWQENHHLCREQPPHHEAFHRYSRQ